MIASRFSLTDIMVAIELALCLLACSCAFDMVIANLSDIHTERYKCSKLCSSDSSYPVPIVYPVATKMKCAAVCSKLPWCAMYSVKEPEDATVSKVPLLKSCQLFMDASSACSVPASSISNAPVCIKESDGKDNVSLRCSMTSQRVLQVVNSKLDFLANEAYVHSLLSLGFNVAIQFLFGTSKYTVRASHIRMGLGTPRTVCISILDYLSNVNMTERSFCSNGSRAPGFSSSTATPEPFYWDVKIPQSGKMITNRKIFTTGGDSSALLSAIRDGADFKVLYKGDNKLVHADVILQQSNDKISVQSRIHENGQVNLMSHLINGSTEILTWSPTATSLSDPVVENLHTILLSHSCWQKVSNTSDTSNLQTDLKRSVDLGRNVRVRLSTENLIIFASADYVQVNTTSEMVTAFLLGVLVQKSFLLDVVSDLLKSVLGGATQNPTKWTHYLVTSDGKVAVFTTPVGSSNGSSSSVAATVEWFEEVRNWEIVHSSNSNNRTSLAVLVSRVLSGSEVRVRVQDGAIQKWFSCDTIQVNNTGDNVKCHISSQVSVNITGSTSILSWLASKTSGIQQCTIKSECFTLDTNNVSAVLTTSCMWPSKDFSFNPMPEKVDWFVSQ